MPKCPVGYFGAPVESVIDTQNALQSSWAYPCRALAGNGEGKQQDHAVTSASFNTMLTTTCWVAELWGWVPPLSGIHPLLPGSFLFPVRFTHGCLSSMLLFAWEEARWCQEENQYHMKENCLTWTLSCQMSFLSRGCKSPTLLESKVV